MAPRRAQLRRRPAARPAARRGAGEAAIRRCLFFGRRRRPKALVVLLHGLNDSAEACADGVVGPWAEGLPRALLAVPQAPERTGWSSDDDPGYTWIKREHTLPLEALRRSGPRSRAYLGSVRRFHRAVSASCRRLDQWLSALLAERGLSNRDVVLAGFSQGSILAALVGARRNVRGVIVCGGVPYAGRLRLADLMPERTRARFCAVNGSRDTFVQRRPLEDLLSRTTCEWNWSKGVGHDFPAAWYATELRWMQALFGGQPAGPKHDPQRTLARKPG